MRAVHESVPQRLPRSLYAETARGPAACPVLENDIRVTAAVVGGGFTGLSTALHLAQKGVSVAVVEAREPGWGASGRNGGQVNPGLKHEPDAIEADFGRDLGSRMVALSGGAPQRVFDLIREHQIRCEASQNGTIRAAFSPSAEKFLKRATDSLQARGAPVEWLDRDRIATLTGTDRYRAGALDRRGGSINPLGYARGLAEAAMRAGASVYGGTPAVSLRREGSQWHLSTPQAAVRADWVVLATNGYTDDLWPGLRRSVVPVFSGIAATKPLPDAIASRILPLRSVLYEHEPITVYYRLDSSNRLLMGGRSELRPAESPAAFSNLTDYARRLWPFLDAAEWTHGWNGQIALTTDHYPHLHEPADGLIACLGYNGRGIAMATVMGGEIARRITGTPAAELDMPVGPIKPIPFHGLWPVAASIRITYGRARAALGI